MSRRFRTFRAAVCALLAAWVLTPAAFAQDIETEDILNPGDQGFLAEDIVEDVRAAQPVSGEPAPGPVRAERAFTLVFDYPLGGLREEEEVTSAVQSWISDELLPTDLVAVAGYYGSELRIQQDFTTDHQALAEAVADAVRGRIRESSPAPLGTPSLRARLPQEEELRPRTANFYGVLQVLAEASDGVPGSKSLLVFSKGFGRRLPADMVVAAPELGLTERLPVLAAQSPLLEKYLSDRHLYEPTLQALKTHEVTLYPVDLATDYRETFPLAGVMSQLAASTGGRYLYPADDLPKLFTRILEDGPRPHRQQPDEARGEQAAGGGRRGENVSTFRED